MSVVEQVRGFNRFYTREIGLLMEHLPQSKFSLAEARVLYELAQSREQTAADIIRTLGMDKAHVSRIVARFRDAGMLKTRVSPEHGKHKLLSLTAVGKKAFKQVNDGTESQIEKLIGPLTAQDRQRLSKGMSEIRKALQATPVSAQDVQFRPLRVGDVGWITHRQAILYGQEYGWDWTYEGLVARILGDFATHFDPSHEDAWIAELDGQIVGSVFLMKTDDEGTAKLRLLYVEPAARGLGVGSRLVRKCIERARELGYRQLTLWTNSVLASARKIYEAAGFELIEENPHHSFGKELIGQTWALDLESRRTSLLIAENRNGHMDGEYR
jgi:DNA-binding MarR family transcriptional regulator/GNAT superfamily N-acetyltransferase